MRSRRTEAEVSPTNVRDIAASFVGRAGDIAGIGEALGRGARLVTVTGPGGIGKSRLLVRLARAQLETYAAHGGGGVWFCDLTDARGIAGICSSVAAAMGIRSSEGADVVHELAQAIARRGRILVALDNFEHLAEWAVHTVGAWLRTT